MSSLSNKEKTGNSGQLKIRAAEPEDAQAIADIDAAHTGVHKPAHWEELIMQCGKSQGVALVAIVDNASDAMAADRNADSAHRGHALVGYVLGEIRTWEFGSPPSGWIYAIGVLPKHQGQNVGAQLFDAACMALKQVDPSLGAIRTMVRRDDIALLRYFRSVGFSAGPFVELEVSL